MATSYISLGQILKEKRVISEEQLNLALERQKMQSIRLGEALTEMRFANHEDVIGGLAEQFDFQVVNPMESTIPQDVISSVPKNIAKKHNIIPVAISK